MDVPKPMGLQLTLPFLQILLDKLHEENFRRVVMSVGHNKKILLNFLFKLQKN